MKGGGIMYFGILKITDWTNMRIFMFWIHSDRNPFQMAAEIGKNAVGGNNLTYSMKPTDTLSGDERAEWMNGEEWLEV
jgi:hypothetical protein